MATHHAVITLLNMSLNHGYKCPMGYTKFEGSTEDKHAECRLCIHTGPQNQTSWGLVLCAKLKNPYLKSRLQFNSTHHLGLALVYNSHDVQQMLNLIRCCVSDCIISSCKMLQKITLHSMVQNSSPLDLTNRRLNSCHPRDRWPN